ncbi:uncharacterized protein LOC111874531 [Cryptotermes secundus]|uniref:uncharacterized protein LOC111874531 n=1 Tax=Cryptotermes secundus TaxID=105785 RepID=UPI000CD7C48C|nr:uncharacterized protein LOC111874531 [Cryptotermes secundus]
MAGASVPGYHAFWTEKRASLQAECKENVKQYPAADEHYRRLFKIICDIEDVASFTPATIGESVEWAAIINAAEESREGYCKALKGKILFSALYGTYTVTLNDLKSLVKARTSEATKTQTKPSQEEDFKEVRRRKRQSTTESAPTSKKAAAATGNTQTKEVPTRNYFAPLRVTTMDTDSAGDGATALEEGSTTLEVDTSGRAGRPPPIIITTTVNLIHLQKQLKNVVSGDFEFRNTKSGTRVITKSMADFEAVKSYLSNNKLSYFTFFPKTLKPIKAVFKLTE